MYRRHVGHLITVILLSVNLLFANCVAKSLQKFGHLLANRKLQGFSSLQPVVNIPGEGEPVRILQRRSVVGKPKCDNAGP